MASEQSARGDSAARRRWRRGWRWAAVVVGALVVASAAVAVVAALQVLDARDQLTSAQAEAEAARDALTAGRIDAAHTAFQAAAAAADAAADQLAGGVLGSLHGAPRVGPNLVAGHGLAVAARDAAQAGALVSGAVLDLPGGVAALKPFAGRFPLEAISALGPPLREATTLLDGAAARAAATPGEGLLALVAEQRSAAVALLAETAEQAHLASDIVSGLPRLLGAEGPQRYFFGASTPAEQRGTGGFIGSYSLLVVDDGRLEFGEFSASSLFPVLDGATLPEPSPDFAERYGRFNSAGYLLNINITPDFPSAARAIEQLWAATQPRPVDGTLVVDPFAFQELLALTGPVQAPELGRITADNVVAKLANEAYERFGDQLERKEILGDVAVQVLTRLLTAPEIEPLTLVRTLGRVVGGGHLLMHTSDPQVQEAIAETPLGGALLDPEGDFFTVVTTNGALNKIDFYEERALSYTAQLHPGGTVRSRLDVTLHNGAPASGLKPYVIGPSGARPFLRAGDGYPLVSVVGPSGALLTSFVSDQRRPDPIEVTAELGHPVWETYTRIPSGRTRRLRYESVLDHGWQDSGRAGRYRLTVQGQTTIRPTSLEVTIEPPPGMRVTHAGQGLRQRGDRLVYRGTLARTMTFTVDLAAAP